MKSFKTFLSELKIKRLYHVGPELKSGENLQSLEKKHGLSQARDIYRSNYAPDIDPRVIKNHPRYVHLDTDERAAKSYLDQQNDREKDSPSPRKFKLYDIRPGKKMNRPEKDWVEGGHTMVKGEIPSRYIRNVWDDEKKKWKRWK